MKKDEKTKWRESTPGEINSRVAELQSQLYKQKHQLHIGQLKNVSIIKRLRREISVLKTLVNEKKADRSK